MGKGERNKREREESEWRDVVTAHFVHPKKGNATIAVPLPPLEEMSMNGEKFKLKGKFRNISTGEKYVEYEFIESVIQTPTPAQTTEFAKPAVGAKK